jgi:hypothetical protein
LVGLGTVDFPGGLRGAKLDAAYLEYLYLKERVKSREDPVEESTLIYHKNSSWLDFWFKLVHPMEELPNLICMLYGDMTDDDWLSAATSALAA